MTLSEALEKVLLSFRKYYNINLEDPAPPFAAEATFQTHDEQYFLIRAARISESNSKEFAFFALEEHLDAETFERLDEIAWNTGMSRVNPVAGHRSTDVILVILTNQMDEDVAERIRARRHYQSYRFSLRGWSNYRLVALEIPTGRAVHNRLGRDLKNLLGNIEATV